MTAARSGHVDAARLLLERGARRGRARSWHGQTALMWAAAQGHPAMVRELLAHGADVNARSNVKNSGSGRSRPSRATNGCRRAA